VPARSASDLFQRRQIEWICEGNRQTAAKFGHGHSLRLDPEILGFAAKQILVSEMVLSFDCSDSEVEERLTSAFS